MLRNFVRDQLTQVPSLEDLLFAIEMTTDATSMRTG
jgi:hypothetical protein